MNSECFETVFDAVIVAIEVIGRQGRNLGKWWRENRFQAYQGVSAPCYPNLLNLVSPYAFSGLSFFNKIEYQMRHMDRPLGEVKRRGATNCATSRSYYFNHSGEATLPRPTSTRNAVREASTFPLRDYTIA